MDSGRMQRIALRLVNIDADVEMLFAWLGDEDVHRWYQEGERTLENYRVKFGPEAHMRKRIILIDGHPVGYLQAYWLSDEPGYQVQLGLKDDAVSLDLFIGDPAYRSKGWGSLVLKYALDTIAFGELGADVACCNPDRDNARAISAYQKAGFRGDRVVFVEADEPENTGYERIMTVSRDEFYGATS